MSLLNEIIKNKALFAKLNSLTKYPSILTYHALGKRGGVINELFHDFHPEYPAFPTGEMLEATEKVDGTNMRLVCIGNDFLIGSRTEIVYAKGDRIKTSPHITPVLDEMKDFLAAREFAPDGDMTVIYGEVYGKGVQEGSKIYCCGSDKMKFRIFDAWTLPTHGMLGILSEMTPDKISHWREYDNGNWFSVERLQAFCNVYHVDRTPVVARFTREELPTDAVETYEFLKRFAESRVTLDKPTESANKKFGRAEGIVVRTTDRMFIRKLRLEDYHKGELRNWRE